MLFDLPGNAFCFLVLPNAQIQLLMLLLTRVYPEIVTIAAATKT
jgi:hypothetical protein